MKKKETEEELINEVNLNEIEDTNKKSRKKKQKVEEPKELEEVETIEEVENQEDFLAEAIKEVQEELEEENNIEEINEEEVQIQNEEDLIEEQTKEDEKVFANEQSYNNKEDKKSENIFSKRVEIPLVGLILVVLVLITAIISIIIFKDKIFNFNKSNENEYSNQIPSDNKLNEKEQIGFDIISKWLESYKDTSLDITSKILSYNINSVSLNSEEGDKFIIYATYDIVPASIDSSTWLNGSGEKEGEVIRNKSQYFVIEKVNNNYVIINTSTEKPDINSNFLTVEKVISSVKNEFPDPENLNLTEDSDMIDELLPEKKAEITNEIGSLDNYFKITGSYRQTYILGTFLVNKNTEEKWFVDIEGEYTKLLKSTQILNLADFEVQGDLSYTLDQAILVTFNLFPKNKRQGLDLAENWLDSIENKESVQNTLGNLDEYYALKTNTSKGFILIKKNGLEKQFVSLEGKITDLVGVEDITAIIQ